MDAVNSNMPILKNIKNDKLFMLEVKAVFYEKIRDYIEIYFSGTNAPLVTNEFIDLVFGNYYTWNLVDIQAFINFIKINKPETIGHKISPTELINSVKEYESHRAEAVEQFHHNKKYQEVKPILHESVSEKLNGLLKKWEERDKNKIKSINDSVDKTSKEEIERITKYHFLKAQVESGNITEQQAISEWHEFLKLKIN